MFTSEANHFRLRVKNLHSLKSSCVEIELWRTKRSVFIYSYFIFKRTHLHDFLVLSSTSATELDRDGTINSLYHQTLKKVFFNLNLSWRFVFAWNNIIDSYLTVKAIVNFFILLDRLYCILKSSFLQFSSFALRFFIHFSLNFYLNDAPVLLNVKFNANFIWVLNSSHK